jgi:hypothetical protein
MKIVSSLLAALALAAIASLLPVDGASAQCYGAPCGAVLVPAPNPIPLRRLKVVPAPVAVAGTCGPGCVNAANAYAAPPPCGQGGCGGTAFLYFPTRLYAFWKQPGYTACFPGMGNCYWRRDCWYDSFGRRFCN